MKDIAWRKMLIRIIYFLSVTAILSACTTLNTPFELDHQTPIPVEDSYISLRGGSLLKLNFGSAVIISDGLAITNRHVLEGVKNVKAYLADGTSLSVNKPIFSDHLDLAIFRIPKGIGKPIRIGEKISYGQRIYAAGTSTDETLLEGMVVSVNFLSDHMDRPADGSSKSSKPKSRNYGFIYRGNIRPGFSGGPVVNAHGELVGINTGIVRSFISNNGEKEKIPEGTFGFSYHIDNVMNEIKLMSRK